MKFSTSLSLFLLVMFGPLTANAQGDPRVMFTPNTISVVEGVSSPITVKLAEPIICPNGTDPCDVVLTFAYPVAGVTFNPSSLSWSNATWDQSQTFTVVVAAGVSSASASNNEVETLASKSELYNGYQPQFTLSVGEPQPVPFAPLWLMGAVAALLLLLGLNRLR
jgi:hypothetical protein